jgi:hypothetical protein
MQHKVDQNSSSSSIYRLIKIKLTILVALNADDDSPRHQETDYVIFDHESGPRCNPVYHRAILYVKNSSGRNSLATQLCPR